MAEPAGTERDLKWLWIVLVILVIALPLIWWASDADPAVEAEIVGAETAGADPITPPEPVAIEPGLTIANILGSPTTFVGRNDFEAEVAVPDVPTDRGFWIEDQGQRLFAIIIDQPREVPLDINAGQQLRIREGMIRDATFLSQLPGIPIDEETRRIINDQDVFLVVDEENIEIL